MGKDSERIGTYVVLDREHWEKELKSAFFSSRARWIWTALAAVNGAALILFQQDRVLVRWHWLFIVSNIVYLALLAQNWICHFLSAAKNPGEGNG